MRRKTYQVLLHLFIKHKGKCYYCGCNTQRPRIGKTTPNPKKNMATREHIYSKVDIRRYLSKKMVLCCYSCNQEKSKRDCDLVFNNGSYQQHEYSNFSLENNGLLINLYKGDLRQII